MRSRRVLALYAALLLAFAVVLCRLFYLAENTAYAARAEAQSSVMLSLPARRGNFYDCDGLPLTGLTEQWQALCIPGQGNYTRLYAETDAAGQALLYRNRNRTAPFLLEVDRDLTAFGTRCYPSQKRYAETPLCPHLLGTLDSAGHGASGLEKALDDLLDGTGAQDTLVCTVTAQGTLRGEPQWNHVDNEAVDVKLTLSRSVQRAVEAVAAEMMTSGCILVLDTATAEIRASASVPVFDPNDLASSLNEEDSPFLNRALERYAVGSVFKPVLAAAALEETCLPVYECTGAVVVDGQIFRCAGGIAHGEVDLAAALEKSCNGYFVRLGQALGAERVRQMAEAFGFGKAIRLAGSLSAAAGILPELQALHSSGQFANFCFGQGSLLASPLQVAAMMNTIACGGVYTTPSLLQGVLDETTGELQETLARPEPRQVLSAQSAETLRRMLVQVVQQGTAQDAADLEAGAGGKTGTAQTGQFTAEGTERKNLWFAGFYPAQQPRYTVVVLQDGQTAPLCSSAAIFAQVCTALQLLE